MSLAILYIQRYTLFFYFNSATPFTVDKRSYLYRAFWQSKPVIFLVNKKLYLVGINFTKIEGVGLLSLE